MPGDESVAATEAHELAVRRADAREGVLLPAVGDELRRAAQELDELGGQLPARRRLARADVPSEASGEQRNRDPAERESEREHDRGRRQDERRCDHTRDRDDERDDRRHEPAEVQPLERVDVADHAAHEIAAPESVELRGRERLDALVDRRSDPAERA